jgi:hypothetical protein
MGNAKGQQQVSKLFEDAVVAFLKTATSVQADNVFLTEA